MLEKGRLSGFIQRVIDNDLKCGQANKISARYLFQRFRDAKERFSLVKAKRLAKHPEINLILLMVT